jgi:hypothetical protein
MVQRVLKDFFVNNVNYRYRFEYQDNLSADWILNKSKIPYLSLNLPNVPYQAMLQEAVGLDHLFVKHRSNDSKGWSSLCIHGISSQHTDHYAVYPEYSNLTNDQVPYTWTEIQDRCPVTTDFFKNYFPYDVYHRIRFMKLESHGFILPHSDSPDLNLRAVNISLNNPQLCQFVFEKHGLVPFSDSGSMFLLANGYKHSVWNLDKQPRYHIIVHGYSTTQPFRDLVVDSYKALMPSVFNV